MVEYQKYNYLKIILIHWSIGAVIDRPGHLFLLLCRRLKSALIVVFIVGGERRWRTWSAVWRWM